MNTHTEIQKIFYSEDDAFYKMDDLYIYIHPHVFDVYDEKTVLNKLQTDQSNKKYRPNLCVQHTDRIRYFFDTIRYTDYYTYPQTNYIIYSDKDLSPDEIDRYAKYYMDHYKDYMYFEVALNKQHNIRYLPGKQVPTLFKKLTNTTS